MKGLTRGEYLKEMAKRGTDLYCVSKGSKYLDDSDNWIDSRYSAWTTRDKSEAQSKATRFGGDVESH